jgi:hypothetical protein
LGYTRGKYYGYRYLIDGYYVRRGIDDVHRFADEMQDDNTWDAKGRASENRVLV